MIKQRKYVIGLAASLVLASAVALYVWFDNRRSLGSYGARVLFESMMRGEPPPPNITVVCPESPLVDCSKENMRRLFVGYIKPRLKGYRILSWIADDTDQSGCGIAAFDLARPQGGTFHGQISAYVSPKGFRTSLAEIIGCVAQIDGNYQGIGTQVEMLHRKIDASWRERGELAKYGIRCAIWSHDAMAWPEWDRMMAEAEPKIIAELARLAKLKKR